MIDYHLGKANVVVDALSIKNKVIAMDSNECDNKELIELGKINVKIEVGPRDSFLARLKI